MHFGKYKVEENIGGKAGMRIIFLRNTKNIKRKLNIQNWSLLNCECTCTHCEL